MNISITIFPRQKALNIILALIIVIFALLRFANLNADFPLGITRSGVLYTDEGWYANAAVRHYFSGNWYLAGDFNPAISMPLGQILHRFTFSIFGLDLRSARTTTVVCFIFLVAVTAWLVHRSFGRFAALLTALLLVTNYVAFAFSRLAVMELIATFFVVFGLSTVGDIKADESRPARLLLASVLICAGVLTKSSMIFAVPLAGCLAWRQGSSFQERLTFLSASIVVMICVIGSHQLIAKVFFPEDSAYFAEINFYSRLHDSFEYWLFNLPQAIKGIEVLGTSFIGATVLTTATSLIISKRYRRHPLTQMLIGYSASYIALLSLVSYSPPRYYLPLIVPAAALCATSCLELREWLYKSYWPTFRTLSIFPMIIVLGISLGGAGKIMSYLLAPKYSFVQMAQEVGRIIQEREGKVAKVVLFGHIADSVAIEIGTLSMNTRLGTRTLNWKLQEYHPHYLLLHTDEEVLEVVKSEGGHVVKLASWDVYGNYYGKGQQVQLLHVNWK